jgi:hypothetical protein
VSRKTRRIMHDTGRDGTRVTRDPLKPVVYHEQNSAQTRAQRAQRARGAHRARSSRARSLAWRRAAACPARIPAQ